MQSVNGQLSLSDFGLTATGNGAVAGITSLEQGKAYWEVTVLSPGYYSVGVTFRSTTKLSEPQTEDFSSPQLRQQARDEGFNRADIIGFQLRVAPPSGETVASEETAAESAFGGERKQSMMKSKLRANLSKSMSLDKPSMESEEGILLAGGETIGILFDQTDAPAVLRLYRRNGEEKRSKVESSIELPLSLTRKGEPKPAFALRSNRGASSAFKEAATDFADNSRQNTNDANSASITVNLDGEGADFSLPIPDGSSGIMPCRSVI